MNKFKLSFLAFALIIFTSVSVYATPLLNLAISSSQFISAAAAPPAAVFTQSGADLDGSTEYFRNATLNSIGIGNAYTLCNWMKLDANGNSWMTIHQASGVVDYVPHSQGGAENLKPVTWNTSIIKQFSGSTAFSTDRTAYLGCHSWDGTDMEIYVNGSKDTPYTKIIDSSGTMGNSNRRVTIGANENAAGKFDGVVGPSYIWSVALQPDSVAAIYDSGSGYTLDMRDAIGAYSGADVTALVHQWSICKDDADIGADYVTSGGIDVDTDAVNITAADCVAF